MDETLDFWNLYAEEGGSSLEDMERILDALRNSSAESPEHPSLVAAFFRAIHTFKGGARSMGFSVIESRAHLGEDLVGQVRDEGVPFTPEMHDILLELVDTLWGMLHESIGQKADVDPKPTMGLMERMRQLRDSTQAMPAENGLETNEEPVFLVDILEASTTVETLPQESLLPDGAASSVNAEMAEMIDEALIFEPVDPGQLANDPVYQAIFADMLYQAVWQMHEMATRQGVAGEAGVMLGAEADKMIHAARRLGFQDWIERLGGVNDAIANGMESFETWMTGLAAYHGECFPGEPPIALSPITLPMNSETCEREVQSPGEMPTQESGAGMRSDLAARMMNAMGELVTSQATNRYLLEQIKNEDMVRKIESILLDHDLPLSDIQYALRQYLGGWQEKIEELLQIDLHAQSLIGQLQDAVMDEQVKSAILLVSALQARLEVLQAETGSGMQLDFVVGIHEQLDSRTLEKLTRGMSDLLDICVRQRVFHVQTGPFFTVELEKSEDSVSVHMCATSCDLPAETGADLDRMANDVKDHGGRLVWVIDPDNAIVDITLHLPLTMSVMDGMVLRVGVIDYVMPIAAIQRIVLPEASAVVQVAAYGAAQRVLRLDNHQVVAIRHLSPGPHSHVAPDRDHASMRRQIFVIAGKEGMQSVAVPVDELLGQQQVLIRPLLGFLALMEGIVGCTLLGSGQVGMVLNMNHLLSRRKHAA